MIKQKIWFEEKNKAVFGPGRRMLLQAIDECRSLNAAAKKLNMSYRAAWGRLRATEERLGMKLVHIDNIGGAMHLTEEARELINKFNELESKTESFVNNMCQELDFSMLATKASEREDEEPNHIT